MNNEKNKAIIAGTVCEVPGRYVCRGEKFWSFYIETKRKSGVVDTIEVNSADSVLKEEPKVGQKICVYGQIRSYTRIMAEGRRRLDIVLFAQGTEEYESDRNEAAVCGYFCKPINPRRTPSGRLLGATMIAVSRTKGKSDYIPVLLWERQARRAEKGVAGNNAEWIVSGRLQSRIYKKREEGGVLVRTVWEISCNQLQEGIENE